MNVAGAVDIVDLVDEVDISASPLRSTPSTLSTKKLKERLP